jgi:hypothetical protein
VNADDDVEASPSSKAPTITADAPRLAWSLASCLRLATDM